MFERLKNSKLAYVIALSSCLNVVVGCTYLTGAYDKRFVKYKPTFQDRAIARSMVMDKSVLVDNRYTEIEALIKIEESQKTGIKNALSAMVNANNKKERKNEIVKECMNNISKVVPEMQKKGEAEVTKVKSVLEGLVDAAIEQEEKEYVVNGLKFKVKDNCIYFTELDISVPLTDIRVSDADVVGFSSDIQKALRARMDTARRVRLGSGSAQVLAAAAGASLGLATGSVATAAALAAFSAVIPEMQHIFQARDRSVAYEQGLEMIQDSETRYYQSRTANATNNTIETVSTTGLTKSGSQLLMEISACLKVVDKALLQTIPTIEDLQAAKGRLSEALGQIKVVPDVLSLKLYGTQTVQVLNSKAFTYSVDNAGVVNVKDFDYVKGTDRFEIEGEGAGTATVTVFSNLGRSTNFTVYVGEKNKTQVQAGTEGTTTATTYSATKVGGTTATLNGTVTVTANCATTDVWFNYGITDKFGSSISLDPKTGTGTFSVNAPITGLSSGVPYYFQVVGSNTASKNPVLGNVAKFLTSKVTTGTATVLSEDSAILIGEVIAQGKTIDCWFEYGTKLGEYIYKTPVKEELTYEKDGSARKVTATIEKLNKGTCYYYQFVAMGDAGEMRGGAKYFATKGTFAQMGEPTDLGKNTVTLNGIVTTDHSSIKVWFAYSTDETYSHDSSDKKLDGEIVNKSVPIAVTGLTPNTTYNYIIKVTDAYTGFAIPLDVMAGKFTTTN